MIRCSDVPVIRLLLSARALRPAVVATERPHLQVLVAGRVRHHLDLPVTGVIALGLLENDDILRADVTRYRASNLIDFAGVLWEK